MAQIHDATDSQMALLADLAAGLEAAEQTISGVQAVRDGMLALASRVALEIARQGDHPDYGDMALRAVAAEIGAAQRVSDRTIEGRMAAAVRVVDDFPTVWVAQGAGRITAAHTRVIVEAGAHLDSAEDRAGYAREVLVVAEAESPNRLRRHARRIAEEYQTRTITERHRDARELRRVWVNDLDDGMSELGMRGPSTLVHGIYDRLSQMAHAVHEHERRGRREPGAAGEDVPRRDGAGADGMGPGAAGKDAADAAGEDSVAAGLAPDASAAADATPLPETGRAAEPAADRSVDQLRADLLCDLALTAGPTCHGDEDVLLDAIQARVEVTVPVLSLMNDEGETGTERPAGGAPPGELDGRVPIDVATARRLAGAASGWERVLTDPISGALLAVDRYRPGDQLKRHLRARDQRCRFPTCGLAARKCDIDHTHAAAEGGETCDANLAHFCRRHHMMKHHSPWQVAQTSRGVLEWRSPTGRVYVDRPPTQNTVRFTPTPPAPPRESAREREPEPVPF